MCLHCSAAELCSMRLQADVLDAFRPALRVMLAILNQIRMPDKLERPNPGGSPRRRQPRSPKSPKQWRPYEFMHVYGTCARSSSQPLSHALVLRVPLADAPTPAACR